MRMTTLAANQPYPQQRGSTIAAFAYTLDKAGNRLSKSGTTDETYGYDVM